MHIHSSGTSSSNFRNSSGSFVNGGHQYQNNNVRSMNESYPKLVHFFVHPQGGYICRHCLQRCPSIVFVERHACDLNTKSKRQRFADEFDSAVLIESESNASSHSSTVEIVTSASIISPTVDESPETNGDPLIPLIPIQPPSIEIRASKSASKPGNSNIAAVPKMKPIIAVAPTFVSTKQGIDMLRRRFDLCPFLLPGECAALSMRLRVTVPFVRQWFSEQQQVLIERVGPASFTIRCPKCGAVCGSDLGAKSCVALQKHYTTVHKLNRRQKFVKSDPESDPELVPENRNRSENLLLAPHSRKNSAANRPSEPICFNCLKSFRNRFSLQTHVTQLKCTEHY